MLRLKPLKENLRRRSVPIGLMALLLAACDATAPSKPPPKAAGRALGEVVTAISVEGAAGM